MKRWTLIADVGNRSGWYRSSTEPHIIGEIDSDEARLIADWLQDNGLPTLAEFFRSLT